MYNIIPVTKVTMSTLSHWHPKINATNYRFLFWIFLSYFFFFLGGGQNALLHISWIIVKICPVVLISGQRYKHRWTKFHDKCQGGHIFCFYQKLQNVEKNTTGQSRQMTEIWNMLQGPVNNLRNPLYKVIWKWLSLCLYKSTANVNSIIV